MCRLGHGLRGLVHLPQRQAAAAGDRQEDRARAVHRGFEQRRRRRLGRCLRRARLAYAHADAEQRAAGVAHDRAHVGEVEVDQTGERHEIRNALYALAQHVVGDAEGLDHGCLLVEHGQQAVVGHDDQRVDLLRERVDAARCLLAAARALEVERLGHDCDRERADFLSDARDDRRCPRACPTAGAGGDEDHVRALQERLDVVVVLHRCRAADARVRART